MKPIGLQLYSVRNEMKADFEGTLRAVKAMGYEGVEFAGLFDKEPAYIRDLLAEIGLVPVSAHVPLSDMLGKGDALFAAYAEIGCKWIVVPYLPEDWRLDKKDPAETFATIAKVAAQAKAHGLTMLYHNHDFEFVRDPASGKYFLDMLYEQVPADLLETEIDTCWVGVGGEDPATYLKKYAGRAPIVHLKDYYKEGASNDGLYELIGIAKKATSDRTAFELRPVGSGVQNVPAILAAAEEVGASWLIVEQDRPSAGQVPMDECAKSRKYLLSLGY